VSGKKLSADEKAKKRLARHIIGGTKQEDAERSGKVCPECGMRLADCECTDGK
jgi:hypothetical protein